MQTPRIVAIDLAWLAPTAGDSIYEIGWAWADGRGRIASDSSYVRPQTIDLSHAYSPRAQQEKIESALSFKQLYEKILQPFFKDYEFIAAHNAQSDRGHLLYCCNQYQCGEPCLEWLNTVIVYRQIFGKKHARLRQAARYLGLQLPNQKTPADDARIVMEILHCAAKETSWEKVINAGARSEAPPPGPGPTDEEFLGALAQIMTVADLKDALAEMDTPPPGYYRLPRNRLEELFASEWDGDIEALLSSFNVSGLKEMYEILDISPRPKLRDAMIDDLLDRFC